MIYAYITGPSGAGKTSYMEEHFPADEFTHISTDKFETTGRRGVWNIDWAEIGRLIQESTKPVVLEGMALNKELAQQAGQKLIIDLGKEATIARRMTRTPRPENDTDTSHMRAEHLWNIWETWLAPVAKELGFTPMG